MAFTGFPAAAFDFYRRLESDNTKAFWQANKATYDRDVKGAYGDMSEALEKRFGTFHLFRPHRDVRFSKDKSPYKNHAGAVSESDKAATYYVQLSGEGLFVGCGMYTLAADQLERWRESIIDQKSGAKVASIVGDLRSKGYQIGAMESLKTAPRGYAKDHPRVDLLRMKGLTMGRSFAIAKWMHTAKALDRIVEVFDDAKPMNTWLEKYVGPSTLPPPEWGR